MHVPTRLVVRYVRLTGLWAADTPLEPLVTGLPRAQPAESSEITVGALNALESHLKDWARTFFYWIVLGLTWVALELVALGVLAYIEDRVYLGSVVWGLYLLAVAVGSGAWVAVFVVFQLRCMKDPVYSFADRLAVSLKRRTLDAAAERTIAGLPQDSILRVYFGPLL